jgi:hypothetical protein
MVHISFSASTISSCVPASTCSTVGWTITGSIGIAATDGIVYNPNKVFINVVLLIGDIKDSTKLISIFRGTDLRIGDGAGCCGIF